LRSPGGEARNKRSIIAHRRFQAEADVLFEKKECPVAPKNRLQNDFISLLSIFRTGQKKERFIPLKAILTIITTFITFIINVVNE
jgi:hypothetical protein